MLGLLLQQVRDLHVNVEELGGAPVEADALALVELALAVVIGHALLGAGLGEAIGYVKSAYDGLPCYCVWDKNGGDDGDQSYRFIISVRSFISDSTAAIFSAEEG